MVASVLIAAAASGILWAVVQFTDLLAGAAKRIAEIILGILFIGLVIFSAMCLIWYTALSYNGKKQFSRRIFEKIADYVVLLEKGTGLDVGCGSGALTIACAKYNPNASMVGL